MSSNRRRLAVALVPLLLSGTLSGTLAGCSGDGGGDTADKAESDPAQVLADAKAALDETPGVRLVLSTPALPDGVSGVTKAEGIGTHQPAFDGKVSLVASGLSATADVVAVDGLVYASLALLGPGFRKINPADFGAPDPAQLMDPDKGISNWLTQTQDAERGDRVRDGSDVLTGYEGTLPAAAVVSALPSADPAGEFTAVYTVDDDGLLRTASVTGPFYKGKPSLTYDVTFTEYGTEQDIKAP